MRHRVSIVASAILTLLLIGLQIDKIAMPSSSVWAGQKNAAAPISYDRLREAMDLSTAYLTKNCDENGKFLYRINVNPDIRVKPKYNLLRHAGTIYALASYDHDYPQEATRDTLKRAAAFLKESAIAPLSEREDLLAVWSHPELTGSRNPLQAKLGGTGLGLVALLSVEKIRPGTTPVEYLRKMGNFLLFMQKSDGSFYSKYIPNKGGRDDKWVSLYYPGEAALGLLMLYEKDRSLRWLQGAADSIAYLARKRKGQTWVEADHWALLATAKLLPLYHLCRQSLPKKAIEQHAIQICESILERKPANYRNDLDFGCLTNDGRTTPTATRLEGLLAVIGYLPAEYTSLRKRMIPVIYEGLWFLLRAQLRSGPYAGGIPRAVRKLPEIHHKFSNSFNRRVTEIRIDYVQHALSAMILYQQSFF
jgi:hypothetical protein